MNSRRSFFGLVAGAAAGLAGWLTGATAVASVAETMRPRDSESSGRGSQTATGLPKVPDFDPAKDRILILAGAVIPLPPRLRPGEPPAYALSEFTPAERSPLEKFWVRHYPDPAQAATANAYPRETGAPVMPSVLVGTIDELVARYRHGLEHAVATWLDLPSDSPNAFALQLREANATQQAEYARLAAQSDVPGAAVDIPLKLVQQAIRDNPVIREFHERRLAILGVDHTASADVIARQCQKPASPRDRLDRMESLWLLRPDLYPQDDSRVAGQIGLTGVASSSALWTRPTGRDL